MDRLISFIETAKGFDNIEKLKLLLFAAGAKPAAFIALKICPENLDEKIHFEKHLRENKIIFSVSRAKGFEEIDRIANNRIIWKLKGIWYGYDLFKAKKQQNMFRKYVSLVKKHQSSKADIIAGKLYGYPACCVKQYIKESDPNYIRKKYSCYQYYKKLQDSEKKFPLLVHIPCSVKCRKSAKYNQNHKKLLVKKAHVFWKEFSRKKVLKTDFIVDAENDIMDSPLNGKTIWPVKDGHEYNIIAKMPFESHHYIFAYLSKKCYEKGTVLQARAVMQYNRAEIKIGRIKPVLKNLVHMRRFIVLGRRY